MNKGQLLTSKQLWSAWLGNFFEHYDTALFGFLSVFLSSLIFPKEEPVTALILTYAMMPLGMLARPLGALVFGYIGDVHGRKRALFLTLGGMGVVSFAVAFSPTYDQAGVLSPILFCLGRAMQNFFSAGETMGGAIFILENTPEKKQDLLSGLYSATTIGGILFASAAVSFLYWCEALEFGWRILYLIGSSTALLGLLVRRNLPDSPWERVPSKKAASILNIFSTLWEYKAQVILIAAGAGFSYASYSIALILMNGFIPLVSLVTAEEAMNLNTLLLVFDFCALPFFGWLVSKTSREGVMLSASLGVLLCGLPLCMLLPYASFFTVVGIRICLVLFGVAFSAPFHAWAQQLVPAAHRYVVISFSYAIGSQLFGGPTAMISLWVFQTTGVSSSIIWYWQLLAVFSYLAVRMSMKKRVLIAV